MSLVIFILHDPSKMEALLNAWEEVGITGATVLTSTGLGRIRKDEGLQDDIPLLPGLRDFFPDPEQLSRTLITLVGDASLIDKLVTATENVVGNLNQPNTGLLIVLPVSQSYGINKTGQ